MEALLTPLGVATLVRVDPRTVTRCANAGKLTSIRTLGGHRRYRESEVRSLIAQHGARRHLIPGRLDASAVAALPPYPRTNSVRQMWAFPVAVRMLGGSS